MIVYCHKTSSRVRAISLGALLLALAACSPAGREAPRNPAVNASNHTFFAIASGPHAQDCNTCHGAFPTFKQFDCLGCHVHQQAPTDSVHRAVSNYSYSSAACYSCHQAADGGKQVFSHPGITANCASCHDVGAAFAALPVSGSTHPPMVGADCAACHTTADWTRSTGPAGTPSDPSRSVSVEALVPAYSGIFIASLTPRTELLPMPMNHGTTSTPAGAFSSCLNCHLKANTGTYYPGEFHASLANLGLAQPTGCLECHAGSVPAGFVGPLATNPGRAPPSGEMKHDAVAWLNLQPTPAPLVANDCAVCHVAPSQTSRAKWGTGRSGTGPALFHFSLTQALAPQPGSCIDCHANSRPVAKSPFDHTAPGALTDCNSCHALPGTGTAAAPDWLGASASPQFITVGGFPIPQPPAAAPATQGGINNLPHPTLSAGTSCTTCHADASGGKNANGYDHASPLATASCAACHEAGSNLVGTGWNNAVSESAGAGDLRPFTLASVYAYFSGNSRTVTYPNHFYPIDCNQCHTVPAGISHVTTGDAYLRIGSGGNGSSGAWVFPHIQGKMATSTCLVCHPNGPPG